jgi:GntR family transcriptional regulator
MVRVLDRRSPLPLWAQVLGDLRARLDAGEFLERFPTDRELVDEYGVSRHTVRDAVRRLQAEGVLHRERGRGSFVRQPRIEQPLGALYSMFRSVEAQGFEQRSRVRSLEERQDPEAASVLGLATDEPLIYLERVRMVNGSPVALDCSWLPADVARPLLDVDFSHTALYLELGARCGLSPTSGWERIRPALPTAEQRRILDIGPTQPVFAIERVASSGGRAVEWRHAIIRGDLYAFVARWDGGDHVATRLEPHAGTSRPPDLRSGGRLAAQVPH